VQFVGVAWVGPLLVADARDRVGVEHAHLAARLIARHARLHRVRPPLLQRRIVQKRVRLRIQNLVREDRRLGCIARNQPQLTAMDPIQHGTKPFEVHRLFKAVAYRL
jgi:hypothetical protein